MKSLALLPVKLLLRGYLAVAVSTSRLNAGSKKAGMFYRLTLKRKLLRTYHSFTNLF